MYVQRTHHNWMFYLLFAFSLTLHVCIFFYLQGLYNERTETRIEVTLQDKVDSTKRAIPKPRSYTKPPERTEDLERLPLLQPLRPNLQALSINQVDFSHVKKLKSLEAPHFVTSSNPLKNSWDFESAVDSNAPLSSHEYLTMVRQRIEHHKQYPSSAKTRHLEGEAFIYFVIANDGNIEGAKVTKSSGHSVLDNAALAAVRNAAPFPEPPEEFSEGKIPIEVPLVFQLL